MTHTGRIITTTEAKIMAKHTAKIGQCVGCPEGTPDQPVAEIIEVTPEWLPGVAGHVSTDWCIDCLAHRS